ncbi:MAG: hypothetical protein ACOY46_15370 [Bacillota bacterium]
MGIINSIISNIPWIFSGIGVSILSCIRRLAGKTKALVKKSPKDDLKAPDNGDKLVVYQGSGTMIFVNCPLTIDKSKATNADNIKTNDL